VRTSPTAQGVHRTRFFGEDVLAGRDGGLDVQRGREQDDVHAAVDHLLVGVESGEPPLHGYIHLGGD
jgi:hypothetical protein